MAACSAASRDYVFDDPELKPAQHRDRSRDFQFLEGFSCVGVVGVCLDPPPSVTDHTIGSLSFF